MAGCTGPGGRGTVRLPPCAARRCGGSPSGSGCRRGRRRRLPARNWPAGAGAARMRSGQSCSGRSRATMRRWCGWRPTWTLWRTGADPVTAEPPAGLDGPTYPVAYPEPGAGAGPPGAGPDPSEAGPDPSGARLEAPGAPVSGAGQGTPGAALSGADLGTPGAPVSGAGAGPRSALEAVRLEVGKAVVGQDSVVTGLVICLLCRGHALLEGVPGVAKTLLVRSLAGSLSLQSARVQFTADLMPGDLTGSLIYDAKTALFQFREGPVFTNLLLADEI